MLASRHTGQTALIYAVFCCLSERPLGARIAIDDVGAGYSGLTGILKMKPQIIKLEMGLVRNIDTDFARQTLVRVLVHFKNRIQSELIAECVETSAERATLEDLGVDKIQGYLLGRPGN